jgi:hypothetical protein
MTAAFLLLRRGGVTWGVAQGEVHGLARRGRGFEVSVGAGRLSADEILGLATDLRLHPAGAVLRRFWPEAARALAVHAARPVVLIDPAAPPAALLATAPAAPPEGDPDGR